jgi:hypothetical protein
MNAGGLLEALLILLALGFVIGLPVAVIVLLVGHSRLSARSRALESQVASLGRQVERLSLQVRPSSGPVSENPWGVAAVRTPEEAVAPAAPVAENPLGVAPVPPPEGAVAGEPIRPDDLPSRDPTDQNQPLVIRRDRFASLETGCG